MGVKSCKMDRPITQLKIKMCKTPDILDFIFLDFSHIKSWINLPSPKCTANNTTLQYT